MKIPMDSFGIGCFRGRQNNQVYCLRFSEVPCGFKISAITTNRKGKIKEAGHFKAMADPEISKLLCSAFELEETDKIVTESIRSRIPNEGIASKLFEVGFPYLVAMRRPHIIAFTNEGFERIYPKYSCLGYIPLEILNIEVLPENMKKLTGWRYKDYSKE